MNIETNIPSDQVAPVATQAPVPEPQGDAVAPTMTLEQAQKAESDASTRLITLTINHAADENVETARRAWFEARDVRLKVQNNINIAAELDLKEVKPVTDLRTGTLEAHDVNDRLNGQRLANKYHEVAKYIPAKRMWVKWTDLGVWQFDHLV